MKNSVKQARKDFGMKPFHYWQHTNLANWEYQLLFSLGAINESGIVANYPVVVVTTTKDGSEKIIEVDGDMAKAQIALKDFGLPKSGEKAKIIYVPKLYSLFRQAVQELDEEANRIPEDPMNTNNVIPEDVAIKNSIKRIQDSIKQFTEKFSDKKPMGVFQKILLRNMETLLEKRQDELKNTIPSLTKLSSDIQERASLGF